MVSLKMMFKNRNFNYLLGSITCIMGFFNLYGTVLNKYFALYKVTNLQTSIIGGVSNVLGIVGSIVISVIIDNIKKYRKPFLILNIIGFVAQVLITILCEVLEDDAFILVVILWSFLAFSVLPIFTISMDFVCELTYPVGESISGGLIMACNQISGILSVNIRL